VLCLFISASLRICADGGANRLYDTLETNEQRYRLLPHALIGDLDSVRPAVIDFYSNATARHDSVEHCQHPASSSLSSSPSSQPSPSSPSASVYIRRETEQDSTDLSKAINWMRWMNQQATAASKLADSGTQQNGSVPTNDPPPDTSACNNDNIVTETNVDCLPNFILPFFRHHPLHTLPVIIYPAFGGRFDAILGNIHSIHCCVQSGERGVPHAILVAEGNAARIIMPNVEESDRNDSSANSDLPNSTSSHPSTTASSPSSSSSSLSKSTPVPLIHHLHVHPCLEVGHHCGLVPLSGPAASVSTTGLRWNLQHQPLRWGQLISTSNVIEDDVVTVRTDVPLIWTTELQHDSIVKQEE